MVMPFFQQIGKFVREHLELRGKMDEPTLRKYRTIFGIHVRIAAETIAIGGFIIYATFLSGEFYRHRYISFTFNLISSICYLFLILGININLGLAHWPYFFINPIALFFQIIHLITSHVNAAPHKDNKEANDDHMVNMVTLVIFIGIIVLLHGYCMYIVYKSYEFMLDYLKKESQFEGEEMMDVIRDDVEANEQEVLKK